MGGRWGYGEYERWVEDGVVESMRGGWEMGLWARVASRKRSSGLCDCGGMEWKGRGKGGSGWIDSDIFGGLEGSMHFRELEVFCAPVDGLAGEEREIEWNMLYGRCSNAWYVMPYVHASDNAEEKYRWLMRFSLNGINADSGGNKTRIRIDMCMHAHHSPPK